MWGADCAIAPTPEHVSSLDASSDYFILIDLQNWSFSFWKVVIHTESSVSEVMTSTSSFAYIYLSKHACTLSPKLLSNEKLATPTCLLLVLSRHKEIYSNSHSEHPIWFQLPRRWLWYFDQNDWIYSLCALDRIGIPCRVWEKGVPNAQYLSRSYLKGIHTCFLPCFTNDGSKECLALQQSPTWQPL